MRGYDRGARSNPFYNPRSRDSNQDTFNYNYEYDSNGGQTYGYKDKYLYSVSQSQNKNRERAIFDDEEYYEEQVKEPVQKYGEFKKYIVEFFGTLLLTFVVLATGNWLAIGCLNLYIDLPS